MNLAVSIGGEGTFRGQNPELPDILIPTPYERTPHMKTIARWKVESAVENSAEEISLYEGYSGRGMYGDTCFGVVAGGDGAVAAFLVDLADFNDFNDTEFSETVKEMARSMRTDSMGLDMIAYFPGWELSES